MQGDQDSRSERRVYLARRIFAVLVVLALLALIAPRACQAFFGSDGDLSSSGAPEAGDSISGTAGDEEELGSAEDDASSNEEDAENSSDSSDASRDDEDESETPGADPAAIEGVGGAGALEGVDLPAPVVGLEAPFGEVSAAVVSDPSMVDPGLLPVEAIPPVPLGASPADAAAPVQPSPLPVPLAVPAAPVEPLFVEPEPLFVEPEPLFVEVEFFVFEEEPVALEYEFALPEDSGGELVVVEAGGATAVAQGGEATAVAGGVVAVS